MKINIKKVVKPSKLKVPAKKLKKIANAKNVKGGFKKVGNLVR